MVSAKPSFGYEVSWDFGPYNPSDAELDALVDKIESETGKSSTAEFRKRIFRLLTIYRGSIDIAKFSPRASNIRAELRVLNKTLAKVIGLLEVDGHGLSSHARRYLVELIMRQGLDPGPLFVLSTAAQETTRLVDEALADASLVPGASQGRRSEEWRQIVAEELARACDELLDIKPRKTRNGVFDRCFKAFLASAASNVGDTYPIIARAIDAYPTKPMNPLVGLEQWPGL